MAVLSPVATGRPVLLLHLSPFFPMYDTIRLHLPIDRVGCHSYNHFVESTAQHLSNVVVHSVVGCAEAESVTGYLCGMLVRINRNGCEVSNSLSKFLYGDNLHTLNRRDTKAAIECLSDLLRLPIDRANVLRVDVARNIVLKEGVPMYLPLLGELSRYSRLEQGLLGLRYEQGGRVLCFYDKLAECRRHGTEVPTFLEGANVLRYEQRHTERVAHRLGRESLTGAHLYSSAVYNQLGDLWLKGYRDIKKIGKVKYKQKFMATTKKELYNIALLTFAEENGGRLKLIEILERQRAEGRLTRKQFFDLKTAVEDAYRQSACVETAESIEELNEKIEAAAKYNR